MRIEVIAKMFLGIIVISFITTYPAKYLFEQDNFLFVFLGSLLWWTAVFIFFDWRKWVTYEIKKEDTTA